MKEQLRARLDQVSAAFGRLTQREQVIVIGGGVGGILFILLMIGMLISGAIGRAEDRVKTKTEALTQVLQLQGEYRAKQQEQKDLMAQLSRAKVGLVKHVSEAARQAGIEKDIGRMQPEEREPNAEGIFESRVEVTASNLSIDRLQDFLSRIEQAPGIVIIDKLRINKPFRKDTLDVELTVMTFQVKS
jgi:hypothetical protein